VNGGVFAADVAGDYQWADFNHTRMFTSSEEMYESSLMKFQGSKDMTIYYSFSKETNPVFAVSVNITKNADDAEFHFFDLVKE
jgi:hypothetical protein